MKCGAEKRKEGFKNRQNVYLCISKLIKLQLTEILKRTIMSNDVFYYQILECGDILKINSAREALANAKYIVREERTYPCQSYAYSKFIFVDGSDNERNVKWGNVELAAAYITGTAANLQLVMEIVDYNGVEHKYSLHNDIRYNIVPLTGPHAFRNTYEWDMDNPLISILECLDVISTRGFNSFDIEFRLQEKLRFVEKSQKSLKLNYGLMCTGLAGVESLEYKEGVESIEPYAFENLGNLISITLPSTIKELKSYALYNYCLQKVYCKAVVPPKLEPFLFGENRTIPRLTVYIPKGTLEAYKKIWGYTFGLGKNTEFIETEF